MSNIPNSKMHESMTENENNNSYHKFDSSPKMVTSSTCSNSFNNNTKQILNEIAKTTPSKKHLQKFVSSTPLPDSKTKKKSKEADIISIKQSKLLDDASNEVPSKSTCMLIKILGSCKLVTDYDEKRKKIKKNRNRQDILDYQQIIAQLEVKLNIKYDNLKEELKAMELSNLKQNSSLSTLPPEENREKYQELLTKLKYIKSIKSQLKID